MKKLRQITIFTSYPSKGLTHDKKIVGGASYTKNLLLQLKKQQPDLNITVYSEIFSKSNKITNKNNYYKDEGIIVKRTWKRNDLPSIHQTVRKISKEKAKIIMISYEVNMVGGILANIVFLLSLLLLRLSGKRIYFILHQVVETFDGFERNKLKATILDKLKNLLFLYISFVSDKIFVFENKFTKLLPNKSKVTAIPLAIEKSKNVSQEEARIKLKLKQKEFYILYFGFLSPYKGLDYLLDIYQPSYGTLIVAGDANPNHIHKSYYQKYVKEIKEKAKRKNAIITGFVKEENIAYYFAACDMVILPYRIFFSSSYPLAFAFSYSKPVLLAKPLRGYFESHDFIEASEKAKLKPENFLFDFNVTDLKKKILNLKQNYNQFVLFARYLKKKRPWPVIARKYLDVMGIK